MANYLTVLLILIALLLVYAPTWFRRLNQFKYTPIYFSAFPFKSLTIDFSRYFPEYQQWSKRSDAERTRLSRQWTKASFISAFIDAVAIPIAVGSIVAWFLTPNRFTWFLVMFFIFKGSELLVAVWRFPKRISVGRVGLLTLGTIYVIYLMVSFEMLRLAYSWTLPYASAHDFIAFFDATSSIFFGRIVVGLLILGVLGVMFSDYVLQREFPAPKDIAAPVPGDFFGHLTRSANWVLSLVTNDAKEAHVIAIMLVESYFRPKWTRLIEYSFLIVFGSIMQSRASRMSLGICQLGFRYWKNFEPRAGYRAFEDPFCNYRACIAYLNSQGLNEQSGDEEIVSAYSGWQNPTYLSLFQRGKKMVEELLSDIDSTDNMAVK